MRSLHINQLTVDTKLTLSDWFSDWLFNYKPNELPPKSLEEYEGIYRNYIKYSKFS
jgi:hypothetical protein